MKLITTIFLLLLGTTCFSQDTEFVQSNNGLIYSETTISQLKYIVDSLNLKFKICDINKTYLSNFQAKGHFVTLEKGNIEEARNDMEANISFEDFSKKYTNSEIDKDLLVVKLTYKNDYDKEFVEFGSVGFNEKYEHYLIFSENLRYYDKPLKGKWIYFYHDKTEYSDKSINAFYFIEEFSQKVIPEKYARMIQYSDCMVDTSAQIFYENAQDGGIASNNEGPSHLTTFIDYIHKSTNKPDYNPDFNEEDLEIYQKNYLMWDSLRTSRVDSLRITDNNFDKLLTEAITHAMNKGGSDDEFEEYVGRYYSKKSALELKRNRNVVGGCSMDNRPRVHALNIAKLSAETVNWEIFLRSHLNIMNDRFDRVSDGSYAWGQRKTYIKELEVLDINVFDLLLGICLGIENPSQNHYFGNIGRLGRALSETNNSALIETMMLEMISDNNLDDYNRILIYYLFVNYNYNLEDEQKQADNNARLITAVNTLPEYLSEKIKVE